MRGGIGILAASLSLTALLAHASPCDRLAAFARTQPASAWSAGDRALAPALVIDKARSSRNAHPPVTALEAALARRTDVLEATGDERGDYTVFVDHLAGSDLYALSTLQGTAYCQRTVLVRASPGRPAKIVTGPGGEEQAEGEDCGGRSVALGRAFGRPVLVESDYIQPKIRNAGLSLTPWTGAGWGRTCRLELRFQPAYALFELRCGDETVCRPTAAIARDLAVAYNRYREGGADGARFTFGRPGSAAAQANLRAWLASRKPSDPATPAFPGFSGKTLVERPISYSGFAIFTMTLEGRDYVVGVGHQGVGWREGEDTLVAFYDLQGGSLRPLAGYVVQRSLATLSAAIAR